MQCKDVSTTLLLASIWRTQLRLQRERATAHTPWVCVWDLEIPYSTMPGKLFRAKTRKLIKAGLLTGCPCGCRGDYEITHKGKLMIIELTI